MSLQKKMRETHARHLPVPTPHRLTASETDLLAILLESNDQNRRQAAAAADALIRHYGSLANLRRATATELQRIAGFGQQDSLRILAALEVGRRALIPDRVDRPVLADSATVFAIYGPNLIRQRREVLVAALVDAKLRWMRDVHLAEGALFECILRPRDIFAAILAESPAGVVLIHNHPSGDPTPSDDDRHFTNRILEAGRVLGVRILDHVVVGADGYYSFADHNEMSLNTSPERAKPHRDDSAAWQHFRETHQTLSVAPSACCMHDFDDPMDIPFDKQFPAICKAEKEQEK